MALSILQAKIERLDKPGALGSKKKLVHRYEIDLGNWTNQAQRIRVLENEATPVTDGPRRFWVAGLADLWTRPVSS